MAADTLANMSAGRVVAGNREDDEEELRRLRELQHEQWGGGAHTLVRAGGMGAARQRQPCSRSTAHDTVTAESPPPLLVCSPRRRSSGGTTSLPCLARWRILS
jgi:hypothetical protein